MFRPDDLGPSTEFCPRMQCDSAFLYIGAMLVSFALNLIAWNKMNDPVWFGSFMCAANLVVLFSGILVYGLRAHLGELFAKTQRNTTVLFLTADCAYTFQRHLHPFFKINDCAYISANAGTVVGFSWFFHARRSRTSSSIDLCPGWLHSSLINFCCATSGRWFTLSTIRNRG